MNWRNFMNIVKPTEKQRKTFETKMTNPDIPLGKAMELAGYDEKTAMNPKQNFVDSRGVEELRKEYKNHLTQLGLGPAKIAAKMAEWLDATKISTSLTEPDKIVNDYQTQLKAGEMLREDLGLKVEKESLIQQFNSEEMKIEFIK